MRWVRRAVAASMVVGGVVGAGSPASGHVHVVQTRSHAQELANGQNHPAFQAVGADGLRLSCAGVDELPGTGPAGFGLETAHHGPDAGTSGKADGCYAVAGNPVDENPAID